MIIEEELEELEELKEKWYKKNNIKKVFFV